MNGMGIVLETGRISIDRSVSFADLLGRSGYTIARHDPESAAVDSFLFTDLVEDDRFRCNAMEPERVREELRKTSVLLDFYALQALLGSGLLATGHHEGFLAFDGLQVDFRGHRGVIGAVRSCGAVVPTFLSDARLRTGLVRSAVLKKKDPFASN